jgi:hypothetical protein
MRDKGPYFEGMAKKRHRHTHLRVSSIYNPEAKHQGRLPKINSTGLLEQWIEGDLSGPINP